MMIIIISEQVWNESIEYHHIDTLIQNFLKHARYNNNEDKVTGKSESKNERHRVALLLFFMNLWINYLHFSIWWLLLSFE